MRPVRSRIRPRPLPPEQRSVFEGMSIRAFIALGVVIFICQLAAGRIPGIIAIPLGLLMVVPIGIVVVRAQRAGRLQRGGRLDRVALFLTASGSLVLFTHLPWAETMVVLLVILVTALAVKLVRRDPRVTKHWAGIVVSLRLVALSSLTLAFLDASDARRSATPELAALTVAAAGLLMAGVVALFSFLPEMARDERAHGDSQADEVKRHGPPAAG